MFAQLKSRQLSFAFLAVLLALSTLLLITSITLARPTGTIIVNPGDSIQAAINSANPGDTIVINAGTYTESLTLDKAVSLTGVNSTTVIIHAVTNQRVLTVTGSAINSSVVISGLTLAKGQVTGGVTWDSCPAACGGGVLITGTAQPNIQNLIIAENSASAVGGGLYADSSLSISGVSFVSNTVQRIGGGAYIKGSAIVNDSDFMRNTCAAASDECIGGGLMAENTLIVNNSRFISNTASAGSFWGLGGGVYAGRAMTVTRSIFERNRCTGSFCTGGGLYAFKTLQATDTVFEDNSATYGGGGIYVVEDAELIHDRLENNQGVGLDSDGVVTATDTVVAGNQSSGLRVKTAILVRGRFENNQNRDVMAATLTLTGTQFSGNTGRAVYLNNFGTPGNSRIVNALFAGYGTAVFMDSPSSNVAILQSTIAVENLSPSAAIVVQQGIVVVTNTIVASHTLGIEQVGGTVLEDYNLFFGNTTNLSGTISGGTHDVFGNPNFVDPASNDYHLAPPSAAIDAGVDAGVYTDLDGNVRPSGGGFDIGAYEAAPATVPITGLNATNSSPTAFGHPTTLTATIEAGDVVTYRWDFGDGSSVGSGNPLTHIYPAPGMYTAIVTASNSLSTLTATTTITVYAVPITGLVAINNSPHALGQPTTFTATIEAGDLVTYTWNFGDGSSTGAGITSTHTYSMVGSYTATVTAVNSVSVVSATTRVTITDIPLSGLSASNSSPTTIGGATTLTATISTGSNVTYTWNFGDGSSTGTGITSTHTYSTVGVYSATVTAVNSVSAVSATTRVTITDIPLSGLSVSNNSPSAIGSATTLTATIGAGSNVTYTWNFGDGSSTVLGQVVTHTYPFSTVFRFTATVTAANSINTQTATTTVIIVPKRVYLPLLIR